jgi:hypothetical protein
MLKMPPEATQPTSYKNTPFETTMGSPIARFYRTVTADGVLYPQGEGATTKPFGVERLSLGQVYDLETNRDEDDLRFMPAIAAELLYSGHAYGRPGSATIAYATDFRPVVALDLAKLIASYNDEAYTSARRPVLRIGITRFRALDARPVTAADLHKDLGFEFLWRSADLLTQGWSMNVTAAGDDGQVQECYIWVCTHRDAYEAQVCAVDGGAYEEGLDKAIADARSDNLTVRGRVDVEAAG